MTPKDMVFGGKFLVSQKCVAALLLWRFARISALRAQREYAGCNYIEYLEGFTFQ